MLSAINGIKDKIISLKQYQFDTSGDRKIEDDLTDLNKEIQNQSTTSLEQDIAMTRRRDKVVYIYTSGTTGLPKAAVISHSR